MTKWLGKDAVLWAFDEAEKVPARLVSTLLAVARYADADGCGAHPSAATVASLTRKSESQAKRDIAELERRGLLLPGDDRIVRDIRADRRPKVYNLPMPRRVPQDTPSGSRGASGRPPQDKPRGAYGNGTGCIWPQNGVRPDAPKEVLKTSGTRARDSAGAQSPRAEPETDFRAPPCPECGQPFSQELLADPDFRQMALAGDAIHGECIEADSQRYEHGAITNSATIRRERVMLADGTAATIGTAEDMRETARLLELGHAS